MDSNESCSVNWKTCFKKVLAPHLLNSSVELNDASHPLNPINLEGRNYISTTPFLNNPEKLKRVQNINSSLLVESVDNFQSFIDDCQNLDLTDDELNSENPIETEENVAGIIAADAAELAKNFKELKSKKKCKYFYNIAETNRNAPDWNIAFKQVLDSKSVPENSLKTLKEFVDKKPYLLYPKLLNSWGSNPQTYNRLYKEDYPFGNMEVPARSSSENCNEEKHYSEEEKKILEILKQAKTFKCPKKPHMNIFDGAGVNCFKDNKIKSSTKNSLSNAKKPKNVPPPGGWVCVKPVTIEEARSRPPNIISTECWDWNDDDW